ELSLIEKANKLYSFSSDDEEEGEINSKSVVSKPLSENKETLNNNRSYPKSDIQVQKEKELKFFSVCYKDLRIKLKVIANNIGKNFIDVVREVSLEELNLNNQLFDNE